MAERLARDLLCEVSTGFVAADSLDGLVEDEIGAGTGMVSDIEMTYVRGYDEQSAVVTITLIGIGRRRKPKIGDARLFTIVNNGPVSWPSGSPRRPG